MYFIVFYKVYIFYIFSLWHSLRLTRQLVPQSQCISIYPTSPALGESTDVSSLLMVVSDSTLCLLFPRKELLFRDAPRGCQLFFFSWEHFCPKLEGRLPSWDCLHVFSPTGLGKGSSLPGGWTLEQAPQGSGHGTELPEFEKHLDNALKHRGCLFDFWVVLCGVRSWTWSLWVPSNLGYSVFFVGLATWWGMQL